MSSMATNVWKQVALAAGIAIAANGFVLLVNPQEQEGAGRGVPWEPPGYVIGVVWIVLFACMGIARALATEEGRLVLYLILFCAAYPLYTLGLRSQSIGLAGNLATISFALVVAWRLWRRSRPAALLLLPVAVWVSFASLLIVMEMRGTR